MSETHIRVPERKWIALCGAVDPQSSFSHQHVEQFPLDAHATAVTVCQACLDEFKRLKSVTP